MIYNIYKIFMINIQFLMMRNKINMIKI